MAKEGSDKGCAGWIFCGGTLFEERKKEPTQRS
jgi:hypothetical protein